MLTYDKSEISLKPLKLSICQDFFLKEISRGFRKKLEQQRSIAPFSFQNGRQSQNIGQKIVNS